MHTRFFLLFNKSEASDSRDAISKAETMLENEGFIGGGRFGVGMADYFVIGGRWSGELTFKGTRLGRNFGRRVDAYVKSNYPELNEGIIGIGYGDKKKEKQKEKAIKEVEEMWKREKPDNFPDVPYIRDFVLSPLSVSDTQDDDAEIVTQEIYDTLLKEFEGETQNENICDWEKEEISPNVIGKKWVVIIDYHN